ncbi:ATP-binding protein [Streptomyces scabiei]|uniref:ATP-binding protein n=3 Tax=Streptomyces scabiei TaxID=1930 RepID=UPI002D21CDBC|nr:ATP-binding protein [Streptomyces scabiei]
MVSAALAFPPADARTTEAQSFDAERERGRARVSDAQPAPVRPQIWTHSWSMEACVPRLARLHARTRLGMMAWSGTQEAAVRVITEIVRNAVQHVGRGVVTLTMRVDEDDVLLLDVTDPRPGRDGLDEALSGSDGTGLWLVRQLGGEVAWFAAESGSGKTIRVRMQPGEHSPTFPTVEAP